MTLLRPGETMIILNCGERGYFKTVLNYLVAKQSFTVKVNGWRLKVYSNLLPSFLKTVHKNASKEHSALLGLIELIFFAFLGLFFPLLILTYFAGNHKYNIKWFDSNGEGTLTCTKE
jgi:hypothetical protein